jgi:hypothetical protein
MPDFTGFEPDHIGTAEGPAIRVHECHDGLRPGHRFASHDELFLLNPDRSFQAPGKSQDCPILLTTEKGNGQNRQSQQETE